MTERLSKYALKQELRRARHRVASHHGLTFDELQTMFKRWINGEKARIGRATPVGRFEEVATELEWLKATDRRLSTMSEYEAVVIKKRETAP